MKVWLAAAALLATLSTPAWATERFAIVIGNDQGATDQPALRYSQQDAARFAQVLKELGHFAPEHVALLENRKPADFRASVARLEAAIAHGKPDADTLLVVYYSGHASAAGLDLGTDHLGFDELRQTLSRSHATTRIAIIDACNSGELTRQVRLTKTRGRHRVRPSPVAWIASTSAGEAAQECAALHGGFFSSQFLAGLRGAADTNADGQVTLAEGLAYASAQTTAATMRLSTTVQHPTAALPAGMNTELVLTDLRAAEAGLRLPAAAGARYAVRGGDLALDVAGASEAIRLALPTGTYSVERQLPTDLARVDVTLPRGETVDLPPLVLVPPAPAPVVAATAPVPSKSWASSVKEWFGQVADRVSAFVSGEKSPTVPSPAPVADSRPPAQTLDESQASKTADKPKKATGFYLKVENKPATWVTTSGAAPH
jgi:hypothetical protein